MKKIISIILAALMIATVVVSFTSCGPTDWEKVQKDGKIICGITIYEPMNFKDEDGNLLPDEERLTRYGKFLRSTSLDELPQLFNIVKGDMAIVGPRPLLPEYIPYYTEEERHRHDVRPGLTGLAQISGRNTIEWDQKLAYDVEYVKDVRFSKDLSILLRTVGKVLKRSDIRVGKEYVAGEFLDQRKARRQKKEDGTPNP